VEVEARERKDREGLHLPANANVQDIEDLLFYTVVLGAENRHAGGGPGSVFAIDVRLTKLAEVRYADFCPRVQKTVEGERESRDVP